MKSHSLAYLLVFACCLIYKSTFSQIHLKGTVLAQDSGEPLPFVNIGIAGKNKGTVSTKSGIFEMKLPESAHGDSLLFSYIGFESKSLSITDLHEELLTNENFVVKLKPKLYHLDEFTLRSTTLSNGQKVLAGNTKRSLFNMAGIGEKDSLGAEIGVVIKNPGGTAKLDKVYLSVRQNKYDTFSVRVNIYDFDGSEPGLPLTSEPIYLEIAKRRKGKIEIDLAPYQIFVKRDFVITLEHIQDVGNYGLYFSYAFGDQPAFFKKTSQDVWNRFTLHDHNVTLGIYTLLEVWD